VNAYGRALERLLASPTTPKLGLERMRELLARLGDPHTAMPVLHVAGTKGKGSTCAFIDAILREAGFSTGLTTSPHLCTARERIVVDAAMITEERFAALESEVARAARGLDASYFERVIAMAWLEFAERACDVAVVEVGLGGRLDATNVCTPIACAVTTLGIDHTEHLGTTLADIAREKAGILKGGVPAVSPAQPREARAILIEVAARAGAPLAFIDVDFALVPSLLGGHQKENASVAVALVRASGLRVDEDCIARGLSNARWPGRYETLQTDPLVIVDGAHNATAGLALAATVQQDPRVRGPLFLVVGMTQGRDAHAFAAALAVLAPARTWAVAPRSARARPPDVLAHEIAPALGLVTPVLQAGSAGVGGAIDAARAAALAFGGAVLVCGSLYLVGEVRHRLLGGPMDPSAPLF
jgi:dihydrofolate synthase/folylpolyglutamate synthase